MANTRAARTRTGYDWRAAVLAGVIAGLVFMIIEMALVPLLGASVWAPPRLIAAIVLGPEVLPPGGFAIGIFLTAMIVHFVLSIIFSAILALFVRDQTMVPAVAIGAVFGVALYLVNFFVFTGLFPWFAEARNWVSFVAHLVFGGVAAASYVWIEGRVAERRVQHRA